MDLQSDLPLMCTSAISICSRSTWASGSKIYNLHSDLEIPAKQSVGAEDALLLGEGFGLDTDPTLLEAFPWNKGRVYGQFIWVIQVVWVAQVGGFAFVSLAGHLWVGYEMSQPGCCTTTFVFLVFYLQVELVIQLASNNKQALSLWPDKKGKENTRLNCALIKDVTIIIINATSKMISQVHFCWSASTEISHCEIWN